MAQKELLVAVIGGGIGGLSAALSLLRTGADVHVLNGRGPSARWAQGSQSAPNMGFDLLSNKVLDGRALLLEYRSTGAAPYSD